MDKTISEPDDADDSETLEQADTDGQVEEPGTEEEVYEPIVPLDRERRDLDTFFPHGLRLN